jgi:ferredoxin-type protein NapH
VNLDVNNRVGTIRGDEALPPDDGARGKRPASRGTPVNMMSILLPLAIGALLSVSLGMLVWRGFFFVFSWIGFCISLGNVIGSKSADRNLGRRICILMIAPVFLLFFGVLQRENMQLEETVFYGAYFLTAGIFTRVLIHFGIAKVFGPFIWGRGFCGWACWTAALLDWLPIETNRPIPKTWTWLRIPVLIVSLLIPFVLIHHGYPYMTRHIAGDSGQWIQHHKWSQFLWFLTGNGLYYASAIVLAFVFGKQRAFCKVLCPVSLLMKAQATVSLIKITPSGHECTHCRQCNTHCPMDVDVESYIGLGKKITSSECILCRACANVCPASAIS